MILTLEKIHEVLEFIRLWHYFKEVSDDIKMDSVLKKTKVDIEYLKSFDRKRGILVYEIMDKIDTASYFSFLRLYQAIKESKYDEAEEIKSKLLNTTWAKK